MLREIVRYHDVSVVSLGEVGAAEAFAEAFPAQCRRATFVPSAVGPARKLLGKAASAARGQSGLLSGQGGRLAGAVAEAVRRDRPDLVFLSTLLLDPRIVPPGVPVVGDTHNVEYDNLRRSARITRNPLLRAYRSADAAFTRRDERDHGRRCRVVFATSARDAALLSRLLPGTPVRVVPNGVDVGAALPDRPRTAGSMLFSGMLSYFPNTHGVLWFAESVLPSVRRAVPDAALTVAGAPPPQQIQALVAQGVTVTGFVPTMQPYLEGLRLMVVPLWAGGGTRVKILEAMAAGTVVVTTTIGCEGLDLRDGVDALVADTADDFTAACVRALTDDALADRLRRRAFERVRQHFGWTDIGRDVARALADVGRPSASASELR
jgi:glycosyltransferase involved in cell wall biosynthesis